MSYVSPKWNNGSDPPLSAENLQDLTDAVQEQGEALETMCNPNLLDNWYFGNPVNQRGASGTISTTGYFFDRWKLVSGSVTINSGGIVLNGTIAQVLEYAVSQTVTATVLTPDGVTDVTPVYDDETKTFAVTAQGKTIKAVKLELGSPQTLAHQENGVWVLNEIPDYGEQLRRCQRYYIRYSAEGQAVLFTGIVRNNADVRAVLTGLNMRTAPVVGYGGNMRAYIPGGSPVVVKTVTRDLLTKNGGSLDITTNTSSEFTAGLGVIISAANNDTTSESYIDLSADL